MQIRILIAALVRLFALFLFLETLSSILFMGTSLVQVWSWTIWSLFAIIVPAIYGVFSLVVFRMAPRIARLCAPDDSTGADIESLSTKTVLLFCCGFVVAVWGFSQGANSMIVLTRNAIYGAQSAFTVAEAIPLTVAVVVFFSGVIFCTRVGSIARWLKSKEK